MPNQYLSGDVKVSPIKIYSLDGKRQGDITAQCVSIDIYESVMMPIIYGELLINDGIDLQTKFPIIGEEYIKFSFSTPGTKEREIILNVYALENQMISDSNLSKGYVLKLVSPELYESNKQFVYKKYKDQSSQSINSIVKDYLNTKKKISVESTKGIDEILITRVKPLQAIDKLRRRAVSQKYKSSSFCFFENQEGFNFYTLEGLFQAGKSSIGDRVFFFDTNVKEDVNTVNYRNLLAYEHPRITNSLNVIQQGGLNNVVYKFDIITGKVDKIEGKNNKFETIDKNSAPNHSSILMQQFGNLPSASLFIPQDSSLPEYDLPEKMSYLQSFVQEIVQNLLLIHFYGDASITCGQVITCKLPTSDGSTVKSKENRLVAGNYLISKLRHMITFTDRTSYHQSAECIKGSVLEK